MDQQKCKRCHGHIDRPYSGYGQRSQFCSICIKKQRADSYKSWAERDVNREARNRYQRKNREQFELRRKLRKYGVSQEQYDQLDKKCFACGETETLCFDHDHKTGLFRGFLCRRCNRTLGQLNDDPNIILNLYKYIINAPIGPELDLFGQTICPCGCEQSMPIFDSRNRLMKSLPVTIHGNP